MARRRHTPEQVINKLREAEVALSEGSTVAKASRRIGGYPADLLPVAYGVRGPQDRPCQTPEAVGVGEQPPEEGGGRPDSGQPDTEGGGGGKLLSSSRRRRCVDHVKDALGVSERRAHRVLGHPWSTQRYEPRPVGEEKLLTEEMPQQSGDPPVAVPVEPAVATGPGSG